MSSPFRVCENLLRDQAAANEVLQVGELADEAAKAPCCSCAQRCALEARQHIAQLHGRPRDHGVCAEHPKLIGTVLRARDDPARRQQRLEMRRDVMDAIGRLPHVALDRTLDGARVGDALVPLAVVPRRERRPQRSMHSMWPLGVRAGDGCRLQLRPRPPPHRAAPALGGALRRLVFFTHGCDWSFSELPRRRWAQLRR